jgi:hypothetical protein
MWNLRFSATWRVLRLVCRDVTPCWQLNTNISEEHLRYGISFFVRKQQYCTHVLNPMALLPCNLSKVYDSIIWDSKRCYDEAYFQLTEGWAEEPFISTALQKARYENFVFKTQNNKFVRHSTEILKEGEQYQGVCTYVILNKPRNIQYVFISLSLCQRSTAVS